MIELAVRTKVTDEVLDRAQLRGIAETLQALRERRGLALDRGRRLVGLAGERHRLLVRVGHDGPIGRVRGLGQLDAQVVGQAARLDQLRERRVGRVPAPAGRQAERERDGGWDRF